MKKTLTLTVTLTALLALGACGTFKGPKKTPTLGDRVPILVSENGAEADRTIAEVMDDPEAWAVASRCATEAFETARASGIALEFDDPVRHVHDFGSKIPGARPSMLLDLHAGRRCEIDVINGAIPPRARALGLAAPVNETVVSLVKARERAILAAVGG